MQTDSAHPEGKGGIYIHIPFCLTKCNYCDFYSLADRQERIPDFIRALCREINRFPQRPSWTIDTVFIGGGTPTVIGRDGLEQLIEALRQRFDLSQVLEFTIETNPGEISPDVLAWLPKAGINRLSIGVQSLHDHHLKFLTRIHDSEAGYQTLTWAQEAGIENINLDFIYGLPGQSVEEWTRDLRTIVSLDVPHISAYTLTVEHGTELQRQVRGGSVIMPPDDDTIRLFDTTRSILSSAGIEPYEISNFSRPGQECRHNLHYWRIEPYLGFGPSAHTYFDNYRWQNMAGLDQYIDHIMKNISPVIHRYQVDEREFTNELTGFGLRLEAGFSLSRIPESYRSSFSRLIEQVRERFPGCLEVQGNRVRLTDQGRHVADAIAAELIIDEIDQ